MVSCIRKRDARGKLGVEGQLGAGGQLHAGGEIGAKVSGDGFFLLGCLSRCVRGSYMHFSVLSLLMHSLQCGLSRPQLIRIWAHGLHLGS